MKAINALFGLVGVVLVALSVIAFAQSNTSIGFKNDRLGMSLDEFKAAHHDPESWEMGRAPDYKNVWTPDTKCVDFGVSLAECAYNSTIADRRARVGDLFVDGKLASINITFDPRGMYDSTVLQALTEKFGEPITVTSPNREVGAASLWKLSGAIIGLQPHTCLSQITTHATMDADDEESLVAGSYCGPRSSLQYQDSRVFYVDESAIPALRKRVAESAVAAQKKANGDL
jgi:hypothetical protein